MHWETICTSKVEFQLQHFMQVMDLWIKEPESVSKPIRRADIISDEKTDQRIIKRRLISRNPKDAHIDQTIIIDMTSSDATILHSTSEINSLPAYYPKIVSFAYVYRGSCIKIEVLPIDSIDDQTVAIFKFLFKKLIKFGNGFLNGYQKRVHHDIIVPKVKYQDLYAVLKDKYGCWVHKWIESTDPSKHVFEDIAIATWLICLWNHDKSQNFIDLGCGNGFLTFILTQEGYSGYGIDMARRKLWCTLHGTDLRGTINRHIKII